MTLDQMLELKEGDEVLFTLFKEVVTRKTHWMDDEASVMFLNASGEKEFFSCEEIEFIKE